MSNEDKLRHEIMVVMWEGLDANTRPLYRNVSGEFTPEMHRIADNAIEVMRRYK